MKTLEISTAISFKNILFLTDFTPASQAAFTYAVALARHFGAHIYPAHAIDPYLPTELDAPVVPDVLNILEAEKRAQLVQLIEKKGVPSTVLVTREAIEEAVPRWVNEHGIDLIVMGTHGRKGVNRMLLGSTAEGILRTAACPVLTVGPGVSPQITGELEIDKVLFATSLTKEADSAAAYATSIARERGAELTVLHVLTTPAETQEGWEIIAQSAKQAMKELLPIDKAWEDKTEFFVEPGDAAKRILEHAGRLQPGLIVLGLSGNPKTSTHFRRGVAYKVISSAPCAVLTVR